MSPLLFIHRGLRWSNVSAGTRLYFNEAERFALPSDQVEFSLRRSHSPVARHDRVSLVAQVKMRNLLTALTGHQVFRPVITHRDLAVEDAQKLL